MQQQKTIRGALQIITPRFRVFLALLLLLAIPAAAQIHKVAPSEKVTRAVGVYEWTGDLAKPTAARLVPVSLFINGKLEDAGLYLPEPMPFVLQTGVVFSLEQAGKPGGTVTLDYARNILPPGATTDTAAVGAWYGYGNYAPPASSKPSNLKASAKIAAIDGGVADDAVDTDDKPHFSGKQPGQGNAADTGSASRSTNTANPAPPEDPDRPHMTRRADASTTAPSTPDPTLPADDPDRPTLRHRDAPPDPTTTKGKQPKQGDSSVIPMDRSLNDDPNRPTMQRGKPANLVAAPELTTPFAPQNTTAPHPTAPAPDIHQRVAVSDAANREPHDFARPWETHTERADVLAKMQALADPLIAKYEATYNLTAPSPQSSQPKTPQPNTQRNQPASASAQTTSPQPAVSTHTSPHTTSTSRTTHRASFSHTYTPAPLLDETLTTYELSYGGLPTFVYQAESPIASGGPVFITIVAQRLPSGELQVSLSSLTDAAHLDRTPRLRLIDAVDPDASHRADLLFELRASASRQFALYRLVTAHADQQFLTAPIQ